MHQPRSQLAAGQLEPLYEQLGLKLDRVGLETQPEVAARLIDLSSDPDAGMADFADAVRNDAAITGRLLKLVNSAAYAQRDPVTRVDRACVLLGLQRLRAVALGFYLARGAASDSTQKLSREVWGQSVYRACLCFELANREQPAIAAEAFIIGLMLDAGMPLMQHLLGEPFEALYRECPQPAAFARREADEFPFTHVDIITILARRWRLPETLAKPLAWHHIRPGAASRTDPIATLHRIAYFAGTIAIDPAADTPAGAAPMPATAESVLSMHRDALVDITAAATTQYSASMTIFEEIADSVANPAELAERAQRQLIDAMDEAIAMDPDEDRPGTQYFCIADRRIEIEIVRAGVLVAYLCDEKNERICSATFDLAGVTAKRIAYALGLDGPSDDESADFDSYFGKAAA